MKKTLSILAVGAAAILVLVYLNREEQSHWTTESPEALAELERALEARSKVYRGEAIRHLRRALDEDPNFAAALLFLTHSNYSPPDQRRIFLDRLRQIDLDSLQPRERVLVTYTLARHEDRKEEAQLILEDYLRDQPEDPVILQFFCSNLEETAATEDCFRRLIEVDPNWVQAQNRLGYLALSQGDFEEARERFRTYQYVAPQQANPHDSMGELLLLMGHYDEAEAELEQAIALRSDFTVSYENLINLFLEREDPESAIRILDRGIEAEAFYEDHRPIMMCLIDFFRAAYELHWEGIWQVTQRCRDIGFNPPIQQYRAALWTGRLEEAKRIEDEYQLAWQEGRNSHEERTSLHPADFYHLEGIRLQTAGRLQEAIRNFQRADDHRTYVNYQEGMAKLRNRMSLADALEAAGQRDQAGRILEEVRRVNPLVLRQGAYHAAPQIPPDALLSLEEAADEEAS